MDGRIHSRRRGREKLLAELTPRLQAARRVERELDRHLARRFSAFKYLRTDELGLSRIIADLLDPDAHHGQGALFLQTMLELLPETRNLPIETRAKATDSIKVVTERRIPKGRRIDITVEIPTGDRPFCLAFENKPYAGDQPNQIPDYLKFLERNYGSQFLLAYVPPVNREPDEIGFPPKDRARWCGHFRVVPYTDSEISLEHWLAACRRSSEAEQLNWFLKQAQSFCRQQFGGPALTTDAESREIRSYLAENPGQLQAALAIYDAWPLVREGIFESFLEHLQSQVEARLNEGLNQIAPGLNVISVYGGDRRWSSYLRITRPGWPPYSINLQNGSRGTTWWQWGVFSEKPLSEMSEGDKETRKKIADALVRHGSTIGEDDSHHWARREYVQKFENWHNLVPELDAEVNSGSGEITDYYLNRLLQIAESAIPAIDEVATSEPDSSGS